MMNSIYPQVLAAAFTTAHRDFMAALQGQPVESPFVSMVRPGVVQLTELGKALLQVTPASLGGIPGKMSFEDLVATSNGFIEFKAAVNAAEATRKALEAAHCVEREKLLKEIEALKPSPKEDPFPWDLEPMPELAADEVESPTEERNTLEGHADAALDHLRRKLAEKVAAEFHGIPDGLPPR